MKNRKEAKQRKPLPGDRSTNVPRFASWPGASDTFTVFVAVVETGGFAPAARRLGITPSATSKAVSRLEGQLGTKLLERTTRSVRLTEAGRTILPHARAVVDGIETAHAEVTALQAHPVGLVRISVGSAYAKHRLVPRLPAFNRAFPDIEIELSVSEDLIDPRSGEADVAIRPVLVDRIGSPSADLHTTELEQASRWLCAAPAYLEQRGRPTAAHELADHDCLVMALDPSFARWPFRINERRVEIAVCGPVKADNADMLLDLALGGMGIIRLLDTLVGQSLACGDLVPILAKTHMVDRVCYEAIVKKGRQIVPRIRALTDFLVQTKGEF